MTKIIRNTQGELIAMKKQLLDKLIARELSRTQVANLMQMHPNAVSRLKGRYIEHGDKILTPEKPGPKNGEHNKLSPQQADGVFTP